MFYSTWIYLGRIVPVKVIIEHSMKLIVRWSRLLFCVFHQLGGHLPLHIWYYNVNLVCSWQQSAQLSPTLLYVINRFSFSFSLWCRNFRAIQCRLIVAQMTSTRSDGINTLLCLFVPIQIMAVYGLFTARTEFVVLFLYNLFVTFAHLHYGICVVSWRRE